DTFAPALVVAHPALVEVDRLAARGAARRDLVVTQHLERALKPVDEPIALVAARGGLRRRQGSRSDREPHAEQGERNDNPPIARRAHAMAPVSATGRALGALLASDMTVRVRPEDDCRSCMNSSPSTRDDPTAAEGSSRAGQRVRLGLTARPRTRASSGRTWRPVAPASTLLIARPTWRAGSASSGT